MADSPETQKHSFEQTSSDLKFTVITGAGGFLGAGLAHKLRATEPNTPLLLVDTLEYFSTRPCCAKFPELKNVKYLSPADFIIQLKKGMLPIKEIFHLGACSRTDETRKTFLMENNVRFSQQIWEACCEQGINLYYASSAATYGAGENGFDDDHSVVPSLEPTNLYGWSKQQFDLFVLDEIEKGQTPPQWAGFKFFNVYGHGEEHKTNQASVLLGAFKQFSEKGSMKLFRSHKEGVKDGEQSRDFVFADDIYKALLSFARNGHASGIYNLGTGTARTFVDLAKAAAAAMGIECKTEWMDTPENLREHYQYFTEAKLDRLRAAGYTEPFTSLEEGAKAFYSEWAQKEK